MSAVPPLLAAKFSRPHLPDGIIYRPRLFELLEAGRWQPLILVSAPPGYGKTTLVNYWLSTLDAAYAWLSLDEFDDSLPVFVAYLSAVVAAAAPGAGSTAGAAADAPTQHSPEQLANLFLHDLAALATPLYIVLDDYHCLQAAEIHRFTERVIDRLPAHIHIILIARADPPLRLARWRGRGQLLELRSGHLCFHAHEAAEFVAHILGAEVAPSIIALLSQRTEGWPAGLQLAAISLAEHADQAAFAAAFARSGSQLVAEYFISEVLRDMLPDQRDFLLKCSILDRFCAPLCDAVAAEPGAGEPASPPPAAQYLESFRRRNFFLSVLDGEGRWFRFHQLFRSLLGHHLEQAYTRAEIAALHARAARWFAAQGSVEETVHHSLAAGDTLFAAEFVEGSVHAALNREAWRELEHWLGLLPAGIRRRPALLVARAWLEQFRFRHAAIPALLAAARHELIAHPIAAAANAEVMANIYALECLVAGTAGEPAEALRTSTLALEQLPPEQLFARGIAQHQQLRAIMQLGDTAAAVQQAQRLLAQNVEPNAHTLRILLALCAIYYECADIAALEGAALMNRRLAQQLAQPLSVAWSDACLGWVCYQRNDLVGARACFNSVVDAPYHAHIRTVMESYTGLALIACAEGAYAQARTVADALAAWLAEAGFVNQMLFADALAAYVDLTCGVQPPMSPLTALDAASFAGIQLWLMPLLLRLRAHLQYGAGRDLPLIAAALARCRALAAARGLQLRLIEIDALDALRCAAEGRREDAVALLARSVTTAAGGGAQRILLDLGPALHPLLLEVLTRDVAPAFVRQLLAAGGVTVELPPLLAPRSTVTGARPGSDPTPAPAAVVGGADMLLTNREMDVLLLLAQRMSDKEIAQALVVSPRTVKKHTASIYQKLHVDNRRAAVSAARTQRILPYP